MAAQAITSTYNLTSYCCAPDVPAVPKGMDEYKALEVKHFGGGALKALEEKVGEADGASPHARHLCWQRRSAQA